MTWTRTTKYHCFGHKNKIRQLIPMLSRNKQTENNSWYLRTKTQMVFKLWLSAFYILYAFYSFYIVLFFFFGELLERKFFAHSAFSSTEIAVSAFYFPHRSNILTLSVSWSMNAPVFARPEKTLQFIKKTFFKNSLWFCMHV